MVSASRFARNNDSKVHVFYINSFGPGDVLRSYLICCFTFWCLQDLTKKMPNSIELKDY